MKRGMPGSFSAAIAAVVIASSAAAAWSVPIRPVSVQLGLRLVETTDQLRKNLGVNAERGALVLAVEIGGPADRAGLRAGDVVTRVAKKPVGDAGDVLDAVRDRRPGDAVRIEFVRAGATQRTRVVLARAHEPGMRFGGWTLPLPGHRTPAEIEGELRRRLRDLERRLRRFEEDAPERTAT